MDPVLQKLVRTRGPETVEIKGEYLAEDAVDGTKSLLPGSPEAGGITNMGCSVVGKTDFTQWIDFSAPFNSRGHGDLHLFKEYRCQASNTSRLPLEVEKSGLLKLGRTFIQLYKARTYDSGMHGRVETNE